jgi:hypothetical protein
MTDLQLAAQRYQAAQGAASWPRLMYQWNWHARLRREVRGSADGNLGLFHSYRDGFFGLDRPRPWPSLARW